MRSLYMEVNSLLWPEKGNDVFTSRAQSNHIAH